MYSSKPFSRNQRLEIEVMSILSESILTNINIPKDILITISDVKLTKDLKIAKVYFSYISTKNEFTSEYVLDILKTEKKNIRYFLGTNLESKYVPELRFYFDDSFEEYEKIDRIVKKIK